MEESLSFNLEKALLNLHIHRHLRDKKKQTQQTGDLYSRPAPNVFYRPEAADCSPLWYRLFLKAPIFQAGGNITNLPIFYFFAHFKFRNKRTEFFYLNSVFVAISSIISFFKRGAIPAGGGSSYSAGKNSYLRHNPFMLMIKGIKNQRPENIILCRRREYYKFLEPEPVQ